MFRFFRSFVLALVISGISSFSFAGTWSPTPDDPVLSPATITFNGYQETAASTLAVGDGASITLSASAVDTDVLTDAEQSTPDPDDTEIVWSCSDGHFVDDRTGSGSSATWVAPTLGPMETSRTVTITGQPDDDTDDGIGDPLNGHDPSRDDDPGTGITLTVTVTKDCKITEVVVTTPAKATHVPIGSDVTFTAKGANLDCGTGVKWTNGGTPGTGSGTSFTTKWTTSGEKTVTATCDCGSPASSKTKSVKVCKVVSLSIDSTSNQAWETSGTKSGIAAVKKSGEKVVLKATTDPDEQGAWDLIQWTGGSAEAAKNKRSVSKASSGKTNVKAEIGTSSANKDVLIVWVTFTNFQTAGPKPADSDVEPVEWGMPATKARNGALVHASVDPADSADYGIGFKFSQTFESMWWEKTGGAWARDLNFDKTAGSPCNIASKDESPSNGKIFFVALNGYTAGGAPAAGVQATAYKMSFVTWVDLNIGTNNAKASDDYESHSVLWCDVVAGAWVRHASHNDQGSGSVSINHSPTADPSTW